MISPTNGRIVWFTPSTIVKDKFFIHHDPAQPLAAMVVHVWGDRMVNLAVFDSNGNRHSRTSVTLVQDDDRKPETGYYCEWMPYQLGQAAKTNANAAVASGVGAAGGASGGTANAHANGRGIAANQSNASANGDIGAQVGVSEGGAS